MKEELIKALKAALDKMSGESEDEGEKECECGDCSKCCDCCPCKKKMMEEEDDMD